RTQKNFEAISCAFERTTDVTACTGQPVPKAITRLFARATALVTRAGAAKPAAQRRLLRAARAPLAKAIALAARASRRAHDPISNGCASALRDMLMDARERLTGSRS